MELEQLPERTALWATGLSVVVFLVLLYTPVEITDQALARIRRLAATATLLFGFGVASLWVLSNYVFVPGTTAVP